MDKTYGRMARAEELVKGAHGWLKINIHGKKFYGIPGSGENTTYIVNTKQCGCPDFEYHEGAPCKHILACKILVKQLREERKFAMGVAGRKGY